MITPQFQYVGLCPGPGLREKCEVIAFVHKINPKLCFCIDTSGLYEEGNSKNSKIKPNQIESNIKWSRAESNRDEVRWSALIIR
ncbi:hypothetical protein PNOK_0863800 [Pyrrhoderma noxium]|uniref:Uncharacterized protein n=1 Tax=Pyrrhoderma noxium TaxID=2282107 RepID=A0A286U879_9AGAM|nr:hypothetical protein PNOK_0863800 [Pyrrhoderma noxium]